MEYISVRQSDIPVISPISLCSLWMLPQISDCIQELYPAKKISYCKHDCIKILQDTKSTYNITKGRSRMKSVGVEKHTITYSVCVFVALGIQHVMRLHHIVIWSLSGSKIFFTLSHTRHDFRKKKVIVKRTERDVMKNVYWSSCRVKFHYRKECVCVFRVFLTIKSCCLP